MLFRSEREREREGEQMLLFLKQRFGDGLYVKRGEEMYACVCNLGTGEMRHELYCFDFAVLLFLHVFCSPARAVTYVRSCMHLSPLFMLFMSCGYRHGKCSQTRRRYFV